MVKCGGVVGAIQWGGTFSKKIDPMHFGFTTSEATKIIKDE